MLADVEGRDDIPNHPMIYSTSIGSHDGYEHIYEEWNEHENGRALQVTNYGALSSSPPENLFFDLKSDEEQGLVPTYFMSPLPCLPGERIVETSDFLGGVIFLTNYRLAIFYYPFQQHHPVLMDETDPENKSKSILSRALVSLGTPLSTHFIPLHAIWKTDIADMVQLKIVTKMGSLFKLTFTDNAKCLTWSDLLLKVIRSRDVKSIFAFTFKQTLAHLPSNNSVLLHKLFLEKPPPLPSDGEFNRMKFPKDLWKLTDVNEDYAICKSYPVLHIIPRDVTTRHVQDMAIFRQGNRFPTIVWRSQRTGAVMLRCAQPCVGLIGCRNQWDEKFISAVLEQCQKDARRLCPDAAPRRLLIVDARHYTTAFYNYFRGGGFENVQYYANVEIVWKNLPNMHVVRASFEKLILCIHTCPDLWLSSLEATEWLSYLGALLKASYDIVQTLHREASPVMIHCTDGWDRTPQLTSLAQIMLDPYYRSISGFRVLLQREWLDFGYKFADRCGLHTHTMDQNEISPIFLQFLDCVHQLVIQFPEEFEFNHTFLIKLGVHSYSGLFGTFLCNTVQERIQQSVSDLTCCLWSLLHPERNASIRNYLYNPQREILAPLCSNRDLSLWRGMYCDDTIVFETSVLPNLSPVAMSSPSHTSSRINNHGFPCQTALDEIAQEEDGIVGRMESLDLVSYSDLDSSHERSVIGHTNTMPELHEEKSSHFLRESTHSSPSLFMASEYPMHYPQEILETHSNNGSCEQSPVASVPYEPENNKLTMSTDTLQEGGCEVSQPVEEPAMMGPLNDEPVPLPKPRGRITFPPKLHLLPPVNAFTAMTSFTRLTNPDALREYDKGCSSFFTRPEVALCSGIYPHLSTSTVGNGYVASSVPSERVFQDWDGLSMLSPRVDPHTSHIYHLCQAHDQERQQWFQIYSQMADEVRSLREQFHKLKQHMTPSEAFWVPGMRENGSREMLMTDLGLKWSGESTNAMLTERSRFSSDGSSMGSFVNVENDGPVMWIPDEMVTACGLCQTAFSYMRRKHHCRNCGHIFCHECSNYTMSIPHQNLSHPMRVCRVCYCKSTGLKSPTHEESSSREMQATMALTTTLTQSQQRRATSPASAALIPDSCHPYHHATSRVEASSPRSCKSSSTSTSSRHHETTAPMTANA